MPIIKIYSPNPCPNNELLFNICNTTTDYLNLPKGHAWAFWNQVDLKNTCKPDWNDNSQNPAPLVMIYCKEVYSDEQVKGIILNVSLLLEQTLNCDRNKIYISCFRIREGHLLVRGEIWE